MVIDKVSDYSKSLDVIVVVSKRYDVNQFEENKKELTTLLSQVRSEYEK